jgi:hypothetical protein
MNPWEEALLAGIDMKTMRLAHRIAAMKVAIPR